MSPQESELDHKAKAARIVCDAARRTYYAARDVYYVAITGRYTVRGIAACNAAHVAWGDACDAYEVARNAYITADDAARDAESDSEDRTGAPTC